METKKQNKEMKIKINKVKTTYELIRTIPLGHDNEYGRRATIMVDADWNGKITIRTMWDKEAFVFKKSDPQIIQDIGELFIEASKLITDEGTAKVIK